MIMCAIILYLHLKNAPDPDFGSVLVGTTIELGSGERTVADSNARITSVCLTQIRVELYFLKCSVLLCVFPPFLCRQHCNRWCVGTHASNGLLRLPSWRMPVSSETSHLTLQLDLYNFHTQGLRTATLQQAADDVQIEVGNRECYIVVKNGKIVYEKYYLGGFFSLRACLLLSFELLTSSANKCHLPVCNFA